MGIATAIKHTPPARHTVEPESVRGTHIIPVRSPLLDHMLVGLATIGELVQGPLMEILSCRMSSLNMVRMCLTNIKPADNRVIIHWSLSRISSQLMIRMYPMFTPWDKQNILSLLKMDINPKKMHFP